LLALAFVFAIVYRAISLKLARWMAQAAQEKP
jgi:hypothetical protein